MLRHVRGRYSADLMLGLCVVIWGFNFTVVKYATSHGFTPLAYAGTRFAISGAIFAIVGLTRNLGPSLPRRDLVKLVLWSASLTTMNQVALPYSFQYASVSSVALLFGTLPVFAAVYSLLWRIERASTRIWLAAGLSFGGVALIAIGTHGGPSGSVGGILLGLVAPATFALYSIVLVPLVRKYGSLQGNVLAAVATLPLLLSVTGPSLVHTDWGAVTPLAYSGVVYSSVASYVLTNVLWLVAVGRVGATRASLYANLQPFFGALFAVLLLSEVMGRYELLGGVAIAGGIVLSRTGSRLRKRAAPVEPAAAPVEPAAAADEQR